MVDHWLKTTIAGISISYRRDLDGGGRGFGQDFIPLLKKRNMPTQQRTFEWCSGPGFIGFSILGNGLTKTLSLADVNVEAVEACLLTVRENNLNDKVSAYLSDNLCSIPPTEQWNLIVANPPHFADSWDEDDCLAFDKNWHLHREFFSQVGTFLSPGGVIILQENNRGSTVQTFGPMIETSGLSIVFVDGAERERTPDDKFYFIGIMRTSEATQTPLWCQHRG